MQRREFLAATAAAAFAATVTKKVRANDAGSNAGRQFFEIRNYRFADADKREAYAKFLAETGIAACNRADVQAVGLFELHAADNPKMKLTEDPLDFWMILPHDTIDAFLSFESLLDEDAAYQEAGHAILTAPKSNPAFVRYDSHLLRAFDGFRKLSPPADRSDKSVYELRTYESPSQERAANKLVMFNSGEIPIFTKAGMPPVFFGSAIAGSDLPHLTYMIHHGSENPDKHWSAFRSDPAWTALSGESQYKDNVSKITNRFLRPLPGSQF